MKTKLLVLILALQTLWVVATVAVQEFKLHRGQSILLETVPVDPRDYLRGDYVTLGYQINSIPSTLFHPSLTNEPPTGTPVFVRLEKHDKFYTAESASLAVLTGDNDHPVLHGKVSNRWFGTLGTNDVRIEYGLEKFYVHEGTGNPRGKLTVAASVPDSGNAIIKQVYLDGKPYAEAMRERTK